MIVFLLRLNNCEKTNYDKIYSKFFWTDDETRQLTGLIKFLLLILMPFVCLIGIFTNSLIIATVHFKANKKAMEENQYSYMSLNACCNIIILSFQAISLISQCDFKIRGNFNGINLFCSSVRKALFSQFYKIIFAEYLSHVVYIMSNISYICYSINRLSLVGLEHGEFVKKISKLKVKKCILITFLFCLVLPVSKIFNFKPNYFDPYKNYPDYIELASINNSLVLLYLTSSILYNLINSLGFIVANLVVDINLFRAMRSVFEDRAKNTSRVIQSNELRKK